MSLFMSNKESEKNHNSDTLFTDAIAASKEQPDVDAPEITVTEAVEADENLDAAGVPNQDVKKKSKRRLKKELKEKRKLEDKQKKAATKQKKEKSEGMSSRKSVVKDNIPLNMPLVNSLTPVTASFQRKRYGFGDDYGKSYFIFDYPSEPEIGWLSKITNIPNTFFSMHIEPVDNNILLEVLNKNQKQDKNDLANTDDDLEQQRLEHRVENTRQLMRDIDQHGVSVVKVSTTICATGAELQQLEEVSKSVETSCSVQNCRVRCHSHLQKEGLETLLPYYTGNKTAEKMAGNIMPLTSVQGGFPQASGDWKDDDPWYFGKDANNGSKCFLNPWVRGGDRTNSNMVFLGKPGQGKSTTLKRVIVMEALRHTKIICIDPEREYKTLTERFHGDWIDCSGSSKGRINPLQVRQVPIDEDEGEGENETVETMGSLIYHMKTLDTFFRLYVDLTDRESAILKDCLIEVYKQFGIDFHTDIQSLTNEDYPVMTDLYNYILKEKEKFKSEHSIGEENTYESLAILLKDIALGADSYLWNGYSAIHADSKFVCLDTFLLTDSSDNIKRSQYFNVLSWTWQQMSNDRDEKVILVCDETYLMIDNKVPQSIVFLKNVSKRARKYEAGVILVSHSVSDFLSPEIRLNGQPLLDNPTYIFIFGCDGQNLKDICTLYNLNDMQKEKVASQQQGFALVIIGSKKIYCKFDYPAWFFDCIGNAGGRGNETLTVS